MHSNMFTKISDIINNLELEVTQEWYDAFYARLKPSYDPEFFKYEALEFTLEWLNLAKRLNPDDWQYDSVFPFCPHILIDWKHLSPKWGSASISWKSVADSYQCTHYGIFKMDINQVKVGGLLQFKLLEIIDKRSAVKNRLKSFGSYFTYVP